MQMCMRHAVLFFLLLGIASCKFTKHFNAFIKEHYGKEVQLNLERLDIDKILFGRLGSFGGAFHSGSILKKRPVIFVHGVMQTSSAFLPHRAYFKSRGYRNSEMYATTYGDGGIKSPLDVNITCSYIQQVRRMIEAVVHYTCRKVDVISWSMGAPVSRKAILGGTCPDTNETLGKPLTDYVDTFITTGGANYGTERCALDVELCNEISSVYCNSALIRELNSQKHRYEGRSSFALYSPNDWIIGRRCCGHECGTLANANASVAIAFVSHMGIAINTLQAQYDLLDHQSSGAKLNASSCAINTV
uniref:Lipase n=1 Tax=Parascaris univalens TaxID=6257 RepID=A0A915B976_PARUN